MKRSNHPNASILTTSYAKIALMNHSNGTRYPRLRAVDIRPFLHDGREFALLRDPLQLSDKMLIVPSALLPVLALCDGTREDASALRASFAIRFGVGVEESVLDELLAALDEVALLDNARYAEVSTAALHEYRDAPFRNPALAGPSYPADPDELRTLFNHFQSSISHQHSEPVTSATQYGLVSPHIDYARGGPVYAEVWTRAASI